MPDMKTDDLVRTLAEDGATRRPTLAPREVSELVAVSSNDQQYTAE